MPISSDLTPFAVEIGEAQESACDHRRAEGDVDDRVDLAGIRFLGCALWTDYELPSAPNVGRPTAMSTAARDLNDHQTIKRGRQPFMPLQALNEHRLARNWLTEQLDVPYAGPTVVVTHHGVHPQSVHPRFAGDTLTAAFVSDLGDLLQKADLWLHGHVHDSFDYRVGRTRVVANPRGYPLSNLAVKNVEELAFENPDFDPMLLIQPL